MTWKERVESLVFYGTGDEAYELFCATCGLLYMMVSYGEPEQREILYTWAKEQADESKVWALEEYGTMENVLQELDVENGRYGYN